MSLRPAAACGAAAASTAAAAAAARLAPAPQPAAGARPAPAAPARAAFTVTVDAEGRLALPPEVALRLGLRPGATALVDRERDGYRVRRPLEQPAKVYVEPTTRCNLTCRTCIRNAWEGSPGDMTEATFTRLLDGLAGFDPVPAVLFGGFGEPLAHPGIVEMVGRVKAVGAARVELVTNGCLLDEDMSGRLIKAGLDTLWVSLDGIRPESYDDVRLGALLPDVLENLRLFREVRRRLCDLSGLPRPLELPGGGLVRDLLPQYVAMEGYLNDLLRRLRDEGLPSGGPRLGGALPPAPELGIAFVAMKRNIADLPFLMWIGRILGASRFNVSNVIPYTAEMEAEILYHDSLGVAPLPTLWSDSLRLPPMDIDADTRRPLHSAIHGYHETGLMGNDVSGVTRRCPFIEAGSTSVSWRGEVSACQALLHSHEEYVLGRQRQVDRHVVGDVNEQDLPQIWFAEDYVAFRRRVQEFDFAPCIACGICRSAQGNEEDCEDDTPPRCGACLWAHGLIRCP
jgi:MoaA/NifB/PqqE/SkfB family radical SAM enzyme